MITVTPSKNLELIREILTTDEIFEWAAEDGVKKENVNPCNDPLSIYLLCKNGSDVIGLIYVQHESACSLTMHPYLNSESKKYGRDVMTELFKWFISLPKIICKINVSIPINRQIVYNFAKKCGFVDEGINRASYIKSGVVYDKKNLGLTRQEIEGLLCHL